MQTSRPSSAVDLAGTRGHPPILAEVDPPRRTGRARIDARAALDAISYRLRSGVHGKPLPAAFPSDRSVHRTFQRWIAWGVFDQIWATLVSACANPGGVD
jgi:transposase